MVLKSRFEIGDIGTFGAIAFYLVAGIVCLAVLPWSNFPPHIGIIAVLSLITAYGLFKKRVWAIWIVAVLFFVVTTFSAYMLYYSWGEGILLDLGIVAYLILTWVFTAYTVAKRKNLQS